MRNTRSEHNESASLPIATGSQTWRHVACGPIVLQNSLLRCESAIIESAWNASLNQCCVRVWPLYRHVHVGGSLSIYSLIGETPTNWGPSFNVCPTDEVGVVVARDGKRGFERMRWGLIPRWWSKPLKELRLATFNARAETARTKPFFREHSRTRAA